MIVFNFLKSPKNDFGQSFMLIVLGFIFIRVFISTKKDIIFGVSAHVMSETFYEGKIANYLVLSCINISAYAGVVT